VHIWDPGFLLSLEKFNKLPQSTLQKFKVINPVWIPDFLVKRVSSHGIDENINKLLMLGGN
jgi:hypothetical protein